MLPLLAEGALTLLGNLVFFAPRRKVGMEFAEPADFPRNCNKAHTNRYLEEFYNAAETPPVAVPRFFWSKPG
jgi:hypothetical protein